MRTPIVGVLMLMLMLMLWSVAAAGQVPPAAADEPGAVIAPAPPAPPARSDGASLESGARRATRAPTRSGPVPWGPLRGGVPARSAAGPTRDAGRTEYRFDAMRIDGTLHGPQTLEVRAMTGSRDTRLVRLRRSFLQRILQTLEDRSLHRR